MKKYLLFSLWVLLAFTFTACHSKNNPNYSSTSTTSDTTSETDPFVGEYYRVADRPGLDQLLYNGEPAMRIEKIDDKTYKVTDLINKDENTYKFENGEFVYHATRSTKSRLRFLRDRKDILSISDVGGGIFFYTNVKNRDNFKIFKR